MKKFINIITIIGLVLQPFALNAQVTTTQEQVVDKNYAINGGFESGTARWSRYSDAAGALPVDCVGGSPTVTLAGSSTNPIQGKTSGLITKPASNVQGQGYATTVTLDKAARTKMITVSGTYELLSGTYSGGTGMPTPTDSDLTVYLYDVTGAQVIQPAGYKLDGAITGNTYNFNAVFQAPQYTTDTRDFRVCLHHATTSASAFSIRLDQVKVGVQNKSQGPPVTEWIRYTPLIEGFGTVTNVEVYYRRTGDSIQIHGRFTTGTVSAVPARIYFPNGLVADSAKINSNGASIGKFNAQTTAGDSPINAGGGLNYVYVGGPSTKLSGDAGSTVANSTQPVSFFTNPIPIVGWGSTVTMSDQDDARVVAFSARSNGTTTISAATPAMIFPTVLFDTHGAYNAATGVYTIPVSGRYRITGTNFGSGVTSQYTVYRNGSALYDIVGTTSTLRLSGSMLIDAIAGETYSVGSAQTIVPATTQIPIFSIERLSGPSQVAASESVTVRVRNSTSSFATGAAAAVVIYTTKTWDSHNAYNTTTGFFTAPVSGKYSVKASIATQAVASASTDRILNIYSAKNGSTSSGYAYNSTSPTSTTSKQHFITLVDTVDLLAGETWAPFFQHNLGATATMLGTDQALMLAIERVGN